MKVRGNVFRFGDDINTDYIISAKYKSLILDRTELARHLMEDMRPGFFEELTGEDIIVAGENFGCGSSWETAPIVIRTAGVKAVVAKSYARIFYRNAINIGLPLVICNTDHIDEGDFLCVDFDEGILVVEGKGIELAVTPFPDEIKKIISAGGLKEYLNKFI